MDPGEFCVRFAFKENTPCPLLPEWLSGIGAVFGHRMMQTKPLQPSLMIRSMVSCSFIRASEGIR